MKVIAKQTNKFVVSGQAPYTRETSFVSAHIDEYSVVPRVSQRQISDTRARIG